MIDPFEIASRRRKGKVLLAWATTFFWAGVIFWFSGQAFGGSTTAWLLRQGLALLHLQLSPAAFDFLHLSIRKLAHLTEYSILGVFIYYSLDSPSEEHPWRPRRAVWAVLLAGLYSLTDEYHQEYVHGRGASLRDCGIDTAGAALGMVATYLDARRSQAKARSRAAAIARSAEIKNGVAGE